MRAVHLLRHEHRIIKLCCVLNVNRSSYYKHYSKAPCQREKDNQIYRQKIAELHANYKQRFGVKKLKIKLASEYGIKISEGRIYRLIKHMQLPPMFSSRPVFKRSQKRTTESLKNELNQQFSPKAPNLVWVSDITYIRVGKKFCYLCVIMDLYSRKVIAWSLKTSMQQDLVIEPLKSAIRLRNPKLGLIFHTDRGSQYTCSETRRILDEAQIVPSFSNKGYPYDNAVMESFFKHLKRECTNRASYKDYSQLLLSLTEYIASFYNRKRPHSHNNNLSPEEKESLFFETAK